MAENREYTEEELASVKDYEVELSDKHLRFCLEYLKTYDRVESYMRVYGVSRKSAYTSSKVLMQRPDVQAFLAKENRYLISKTRNEILSHRVLDKIQQLAFEDTYEHRQTQISALKLLVKSLGLDMDGSLDAVTRREMDHLLVKEQESKVEAKKLAEQTRANIETGANKRRKGRPRKPDKL